MADRFDVIVVEARCGGAAMVRRGGLELRQAGGMLREMIATDRARRLRRHPVFLDPAAHADAGQTEVAEAVAA